MASTYTLIASTTTSGSAGSVTFSSIPSTYTDLVLRGSTRSDWGGGSIRDFLQVSIGGGGSGTYSETYLQGNGAEASSGRLSNTTGLGQNSVMPASGATANTFGNWELYIPSYTAAQNKQMAIDSVTENNATTAYIVPVANLLRSTGSISSITLIPTNGAFVNGSTCYLYGIKNS
jgi:hypothetical protein